MYVWLHNESQSESLYEAACLLHKECGSSRKSGHGANRYVYGLFWPLLRMCVTHSQLAYLYHGSPAMKCWPFLYYSCSFTIPLVRMTTVHLKLLYIAKCLQTIFTNFANRPCLQRTRTAHWATQFVLRGWGHFSLVQSGRLICKISFTNIPAVCLINSVLCSICHWWLVAMWGGDKSLRNTMASNSWKHVVTLPSVWAGVWCLKIDGLKRLSGFDVYSCVCVCRMGVAVYSATHTICI